MAKIKTLVNAGSFRKVVNITLVIGEKELTINLPNELRINSADLSGEVIVHPENYSILSMAYVQLCKMVDKLEARKKYLSAKLYVDYKTTKNDQTGRPNSDDLSKALVEKNKKYRDLIKNLLLYKDKQREVEYALDCFKQRKDLLQTLSSNHRNNF